MESLSLIRSLCQGKTSSKLQKKVSKENWTFGIKDLCLTWIEIQIFPATTHDLEKEKFPIKMADGH